MDQKALDRLVTRTSLNPTSKRLLRGVRKAVMTGRAGDAKSGKVEWSVSFDNEKGTPIRLTIKFTEREKNGSSTTSNEDSQQES